MTGQYPRRRETDKEARVRVDEIEARRAEHLDGAYPIPWIFYRQSLPYITASGRLVDPMRSH